MPVTCHDLLSLKLFSNIRLLAGEKGLDRAVSWPHVSQTREITPWVHGGELLFITGIIHPAETLSDVLAECIENNLAGLVILVGKDYIQKVPADLVEQAEAANFPLFAMPYHLKLVDVSKEIADLIVRDKLKLKKEEELLNQLLFAPEAPELNVTLDNKQPATFGFVCMFNLSTAQDNSEQAERLQHHLHSLCAAKYIKAYTMIRDNSVICLTLAHSPESARASTAYLETSHGVMSQLCDDEKLALSFGRVCKLSDIRESYKEALSALQLSRRIDKFSVVHYQKLGIYYLLLQVQNQDKLETYFHNYLDALITFDKENNADLMGTLRGYLLCNGNVAKTAQKIFVHRNTLLYRLNQIRDLLGCDLEDAWTRMNLFVAILVKGYLDEK